MSSKSSSNKPSQPFEAKNFLEHCSERPGVYQMYAEDQSHLYIGKAKNLKKRLASYFRTDLEHPKTRLLVSKIAKIDVTVTNTETEALILERNLINSNRPPYNVIFRDDKSYPYIRLSKHPFPRLSFFRGSRKNDDQYFGPFPSSQSVRDSLNLLQKMFKVRQCEDSFFKNRSRPCLQHQIGRCSAPCVDLIDKDSYSESVRQSIMFLQGKSNSLGEELQQQMQIASDKLDFEQAALYRDQISQLHRIQEKQYVEGKRGNIDILGAALSSGNACVQLLFVRQGRILGSRSFYPKTGIAESVSDILEAFIGQHYLAAEKSNLPAEIITAIPLDAEQELSAASENLCGRHLVITHNVKAGRARWAEMAQQTAEQNLLAKLHSKQQIEQRFEALQHSLDLEELPKRIECFDISHSSGESTVASCVVFQHDGAKKSDYRKFNIEDITAGDDYAAMRQAITRRYTRLKKGEAALPDILLIDGGKGQMTQAIEVLNELQIEEVLIVGVAKGTTRKPGLETLFVGSHENAVTLKGDSPALHLIQQIRDEAHRFAITGHRQRRDKTRRSSPLEEIAGVGPKRRQQLLKHFGGWQEVDRATVEDLVKVPGISKKIAQDIYAALH